MTADRKITITSTLSQRLCMAECLVVVLLGFLLTPAVAAEGEPPDWEKTIRSFEDQDRLNPPKPDGVLFLGSSSIRLWNTTQAFPELSTINRGFGGSQIADSVKFADRIVIPYKPRLIVFYAGDNDIAGGKSPEQVLGDFKALVEKVQAGLPETRIAFIAIKPSPSRWRFIEAQRKANGMVEEFIRSDRRLSYVDVVKPMLDDKGRPCAELFQKDMLHLNDEGYRLWVSILKPRLSAQSASRRPDPGKYSAERYTAAGVRGVRVPMRDGVRLSVDVYRPESEGRFPGLLIQTPYSNNSLGGINHASWFARRGYAVVIADSRGRFDSDGEWDPFSPLHKTDGYDLVEWVAAQPWCTGKVGTMGGSYSGWMQWWTAVTSPPSLAAMVPVVAPPDAMYNMPYQNGILVCWGIDWACLMSGRTGQVVADGPYGGFAANRARDFLVYPYRTLLSRRGVLDNTWFDKWIVQDCASDEYWRAISYQQPELYAKVKVPTLNVTGWFDANHPGSPMNYLGMKRHGGTPESRRPRLVIGAWQHGINTQKVGAVDYGPDNVFDWDGYVCRFFDFHLKGEHNGLSDELPVHLFVMGENRWRAERDWPLTQTRWTKFYFHSGGKANTLRGDGLLDATPPADETADEYTYDPRQPTPSPFKGGHTEDGAVDTNEGAAREDVLVYATPPLEKSVELTGPVTAMIYAATSARDTDWMVRLVDVAPDGSSALLCDGALRARFRDPAHQGKFNSAQLSTIEPDAALEYTIEFWRGTSNRFAAGHRIRVEISSSYFPYFLPNLNTGEEHVGLATQPVVARQRVLHDAKHPSHIVLPVIPADP